MEPLRQAIPGGYLSFPSRAFILAACLGLLVPSAGLASYPAGFGKGAGKHRVAVPGWDRQTGLGDRADSGKQARSGEPGVAVRLAKAQTAAKKKG